MVVMSCPTASFTGMTQERLGDPSRCTVQAPQSATPQPNLVPFMPSRSRSTHRSGMSGSASTLCDLPLILSVSIALPPAPSREDHVADVDGHHQHLRDRPPVRAPRVRAAL